MALTPRKRSSLLHEPQSSNGGGGIGLYITRYLVELHGGRIWFTTEEGKGTTFFVALPRELKPVQETA